MSTIAKLRDLGIEGLKNKIKALIRKVQVTIKTLCGSGFQPRNKMIAAGSRSHNQYNLFFPDNRIILFEEVAVKKPLTVNSEPVNLLLSFDLILYK